MYLTGGPGARALQNYLLKFFLDHSFNQNRDLILMDFRGIGLSEPEFCPDLPHDLEVITLSDLTPAEARVRTSELFENCFNSLKANGIDLNMYNSATVVKDLELLRKSLKIKKWNLWGIS